MSEGWRPRLICGRPVTLPDGTSGAGPGGFVEGGVCPGRGSVTVRTERGVPCDRTGMREPVGKRSSSVNSAFTSGCLLLLVLVADVAAGLLSLVLLVARGRTRATDSARTAAGLPPADWAPVLCFGTLSLAVCVTGAMLLRLG